MNVDRWVDERLAALKAPADWRPDSSRGLAAVRRFDGVMKRRRRQRLLITGLSAVVFLALALMEAPKAYCAGGSCGAPAQEKPAAPARKP